MIGGERKHKQLFPAVIETANPSPANYTWKSEWIAPFESTWGILHKFKYVNQVTTNELRTILGIKGRPGVIGWYDLIVAKKFDDELTQRTLGISLQQHSNEFMKIFVHRLPSAITPFKYINKEVRFCTDCLRLGFHSFFHQHSLLSNCVYHNTKLTVGCPECGTPIQYRVDDTHLSLPNLSCHCGYCMYNSIDGHGFIRNWLDAARLKIKSEQVIHWLDRSDSLTQELNRVYFHPGVAIHHDQEILTRLIRMLTPEIEKQRDHNKIVKYKSRFTDSDLRTIDVSAILPYRSSLSGRATFKAIARHIRKTCLHEHRNCIKLLVRNSTAPVCPWAYAYVSWRQHLECLSSHTSVDNGPRHIRQEFSTQTAGEYIDNLVSWIQNRTDIKLHSQDAQWIIGHAWVHLWVSQFKTWLIIASTLSSNRLYPKTLPFSYELTPFFSIYLRRRRERRRSRKDYNIEFHTWPLGRFHHMHDMSCPRHQ